MFEEVYKACLQYQLLKDNLAVAAEVEIPVVYDNVKLDIGYRADLIVQKSLIIELKAVQNITPLHKAQLLTYLKLSSLKTGLLLNFNTPQLKEGITRIVN